MAALPLTLDTLQSPSNEELATQTPLMSPQTLKADTTTNNLLTITPERPSNLTLDSSQQQHSNVTPSPTTTAAAHGNISPALSSAGSLSPSFLPEMPQWKRDLIQRRKQNVQRTISASSPTAPAASASSVAPSSSAASPTIAYGLKTSTSSSSVRSLAGSNTNIDQVASDGLHSSTKDYNKISTSLSSTTTTATTKVNKQHATMAATSAMPASSPIKEKAEKLFGGQYTATSLLSSTSTSTATVTTKEEKKIFTQQQQDLIEMEEGLQENNGAEGGQWEKSKTTKEYIKEDDQGEVEEEYEQQMATRLTGSLQTSTTITTTSSSSSLLTKREEETKEREQWFSNNTTTQQHQQQQHHHNITGAIGILQNQSLIKCESERLVCTANIQQSSTSVNINNLNQNSVVGNTNVNNNTSVVKISQKLKENQFIKNEQQQQLNNTQTKKFIKFKTSTTTNSQDLKSPSTSSATAITTASNNCAIKKKMVAVQEMKKSTQNTATHLHPINTTCNSQQGNRANNRGGGGGGGVGGVANSTSTNTNELDNNEDLSYGPGIVSKLRYRYLSLALRESMEQQRFNKDQLRRSTSLNNLLDNAEEDDEEEDEEEEEEGNCDEIDGPEEHNDLSEDFNNDKQNDKENLAFNKKSGILKNSKQPEKRFSPSTASSGAGSNGVGVTFTETSYAKRSRHLKRGNDSLKRARSVEALLSEKSMWQTRSQNTTLPTCVTIEDKIQNARERLHQGTDHMPPKRLTSIIQDTERPPPDLVKQTLKLFEASANRRPRTTNRSNSKGEVASKVETFKNIIKEQKPLVSYPKPTSPTKKLPTPKPLKTSTPQASDLLQSPLGRKTLATANSSFTSSECLTPLKANNSLSDQTPDIIPRQKFNTERDFKQTKEKFSTNQINKEKFLQSLRETPLSHNEQCESPLNVIKREHKVEVDSPLTALTKELDKLKLDDNTPESKNDNFNIDNSEINNGGGGLGGKSGGGVGGDALFGFKTEEYKELGSLKAENDKQKQKQINNETIDETNEATVNYNDSVLTKAAVSTPPSSSDLSDGEEDDEYGGLKTKRITRTALDNIAKAGYTQQFKFNSASNSSPSNSPSTTNSGKQIGVIRPLLNTQQQQQQQKNSPDMDHLKHSSSPSSLTTREIEKNRINDLKKSNTLTPNSSPLASLDNVIKSTSSSSHTTSSSSSSSSATSATASAASASSGFSDVDSVISATNSPLWAMRKRRQSPPSAPAENTTMVFNFSNRKEVPDYIENDGVIFRRKRELPKLYNGGTHDVFCKRCKLCKRCKQQQIPNESGFVILGGDLSVETSTDFDCDDFSMCPPSPCDVEFVNANIVIDGKSSIRQKPKDATFRVQFNDTLTSTFEYPSEASLIVDESFSAYNDGYTQPHGSSADDFTHAFQNLVLENCASSVDQLSSIHQYPLHHVADEIIQLPTIQANSPANTSTNANITGVTTPTKNILGNLPLDYPDLEKGIQLTIPNATAETTATTPIQTKTNEMLISKEQKRSRKDLKLPLGNLQQPLQKPPLPVKRFQMRPLTANPQNLKRLPIKSKDFQQNLQEKIVLNVQKLEQEEDIKNGNTILREEINKDMIKDNNNLVQQLRKTPTVLNKPQYACFLQQPQMEKLPKYPVQRSRSNEFQKSFGSMPLTTPVSRSNSLRNLEKFHTTTAHSPNSTFTTTTSLYFSSEVNSIDNLLKYHTPEIAKNSVLNQQTPLIDKPIECSTQKTLSLHNLPQTSGTFSDNSLKSTSLNSLAQNPKSLKCLNDFSDELLQSESNDNVYTNESVDSLLTSHDNICLDNMLNTKSVEDVKTGDNIKSHDFTDYSSNLTDNLLNKKSKSVENFKNMTDDSFNSKSRSVENFKATLDSCEYSVKMTDCLLNCKSVSVESDNMFISNSESSLQTTIDLKDYANNFKSKSVDNFKQVDNFNDFTKSSAENVIISKAKSLANINSTMRTSVDDLSEYFENTSQNTKTSKSQSIDNFKSMKNFSELTENSSQSLVNILTKSVDTIKNSPDSNEYSNNISKSLSEENFNQILLDNEIDSNNFKESVILKEFPTTSKFVNLNKSLQMSIDSLDDYQDALETNSVDSTKNIDDIDKNLKDITAKELIENEKVPKKSVDKLSDSEASEILEDIAVGLNKDSLFDFTKLINVIKSDDNNTILTNSHKTEDKEDKTSLDTPDFSEISLDNSNKFTHTIQKEVFKFSPEIPQKPCSKSVDNFSNKKSKTLRVKTTERIINFKNMACQNVSTYSTFRKSQNFYKHASKSFKNSIKFYETLNEKRPQPMDKDDIVNANAVKRSISLTDNSFKKSEISRKTFLKSSKMRWSENPDSPTENSYSFEYYDALGDSNGNLASRSLTENTINLADNDGQNNKPNLVNEETKDINFKLNLSRDLTQNSKVFNENPEDSSNNSTNICNINDTEYTEYSNSSTLNFNQSTNKFDNMTINDNKKSVIFENSLIDSKFKDLSDKNDANESTDNTFISKLTSNLISLSTENSSTTNLTSENIVDSEANTDFTNLSPESADNIKIASDFTNLSSQDTVNSKIVSKFQNLSSSDSNCINLLLESSDNSKTNSNFTNLSVDNLVRSEINTNLLADTGFNSNLTDLSRDNFINSIINSDITNLSPDNKTNCIIKPKTIQINESSMNTKFNENLTNFSTNSKMNQNLTNLPTVNMDDSQKHHQFSILSTETAVNSKTNSNFTDATLKNTDNSKIVKNLTNSLTEHAIDTNLNRNFTSLTTKNAVDGEINQNLSNSPTETMDNSEKHHNFSDLPAETAVNSNINPNFTKLSLKNTDSSNFVKNVTNLSTEHVVYTKTNSNVTNFLTENTVYLKNPVNSYLKHNTTHFSNKNTAEFNTNLNLKQSSTKNFGYTQNNSENSVNLSTDNYNNLNHNLKPSTDIYFNTSPRPFRRVYEATTVVDTKELNSLPDSQTILNSPENISLTSPRPFRRVYKATTEVNWDENPSLLNSDLNSNNSTNPNIATFSGNSFKSLNSFTLTNSLAKPFDKSDLNLTEIQQFNSTKFPVSSTNSSANIKPFAAVNSTIICGNLTNSPVIKKPSTTFDSTKCFRDSTLSTRYAHDSSLIAKDSDSIVPTYSSLIAKDVSSFPVDYSLISPQSSSLTVNSLQFSANSPPTLSPKTFTNTKHLKLKTKLDLEPSTPTLLVKDSSTTTTTSNNNNNALMYNETTTNFKTMVEVSKPNSTKFCITKSPSSSFSSTSTTSCRLSTKSNSTAKNRQENRNITTISSKSSSMPPKVLPRRILASTPKTLMATMTSSTCSTTTIAPPKPPKMTTISTSSSSTSSTSSCNQASTTTTSNTTPLRRRIPGNTLYYV